MREIINKLPEWVVVVSVLTTIVSIVALAWRGFRIKTKVITVDTTYHSNKRKLGVIPESHVIQFRKLRNAISNQVIRSEGEFVAQFKQLFIDAMKDQGVDHLELNNNPEVDYYELILWKAMDNTYIPEVKHTIFSNHFPELGVDRGVQIEESKSEYEKRFFSDFTIPTTHTILALTNYAVEMNWESKTIARDIFVEEYIRTEKNMKKIYAKMSSLLTNARDRRDYAFQQISRQDGTPIQILKDEWEMIYG